MKVLVAGQDARERLVLLRFVESLGHDCLVANDAEQAWALFQQHGADVLISDWMFPDLDGPELCRRVRAHSVACYTYVVLLTELDDPDRARTGMHAGADACLRKPFDQDELEVCLIAASRLTELHRHLFQREEVLRRGSGDGRSPRQLPAQPTPLVGRDDELKNVSQLLLRAEVRLVTLSGPPGVGKTRLAVAVATQVAEAMQHGACFVELSIIRSPTQVVPASAEALGLEAELGLDRLCRALAQRQVLLVLDNFEHVVCAAGLVGELVAACPLLKVLITSRVALNLRCEHVFPVPLLALPDPSGSLEPRAVAKAPAVALFLQRARATRPSFALTDESVTTIVEICSRLDGLPLAIELAAARTPLLSANGVLGRLRQGLGVLVGGSRDLPERQQTLRGAIDWSYALLDSEDQRLFRSLAVFAGTMTVEAAEPIAEVAAPAAPREGQPAVLEGLSRLADRSLLVRDSRPSEESRFRMLETIRESAREHLELSGELMRVRRRHAEFFAAMAEQADSQLVGPNQVAWLERLDREHDNLRGALRLAADVDDVELELQLSGALARFWSLRGYFDAAHEWMSRALATHQAASARVRARVLAGAAAHATARGDWAAARTLAETSCSVWRELDERPRIVEMLAQQALAAQWMCDRTAALALARQSLALARELGDSWALACGLNVLGEIALGQGNDVRARKRFAESLTLAHTARLVWQVAQAVEGLAAVAAARGQFERAVRLGGGADGLRDALRLPLPAVQRELFKRRLGPIRVALDEDRWNAAWAAGHAVSLEQLVADAVGAGAPEAEVDIAGQVALQLKWLTRREREVAALVASGLHNGEIGRRLEISVNTVEVHMSNVLRKLEMVSRAQLAIWAKEHGLLRDPD